MKKRTLVYHLPSVLFYGFRKSIVNCQLSIVSCQLLRASRAGQLMLVTILVLGGAIIGASLIAGFLMTRNIRQSTLAEDSAKAIFAADAGLERVLYECLVAGSCSGSGSILTCDSINKFQNNSCYEATYEVDADGNFTAPPRSVGYSDYQTQRVARALTIKFL